MADRPPRFQVLPLPDHQAAFLLDGIERTRWHFGPNYPRPFIYPFLVAGQSLTRMGHPGAPDHDHHRSIWFAHHKVLGIDFWGDRGTARIRQKQWLAYQDSDEEAVMAVLLGWYDGHDPKELLEQELIAGVRCEQASGDLFLELQSTFRPRAESLEFEKTNFGFLAVRVAKDISAHFGGGTITNSEGAAGEPAIFGKPARWVDYSGPASRGGITYFDHPKNPGHPTPWHVREDGWMGASVCFNAPVKTTRGRPLVLRYLLHGHAGPLDPKRAEEIAKTFAARPEWVVAKAKVKHQHFSVERS